MESKKNQDNLNDSVNDHNTSKRKEVEVEFEGVQPRLGSKESKKRQFLLILQRFWPNTSRACSYSGLDYKTYQHYLLTDPEFKAACEQIKRETLDELEGLGVEFAKTKGGFMHWIANLKAHRPERWDPDKRIVIQHELSPDIAKAEYDNFARIVAQDAKVFEATTGQAAPVLKPLELPPNPYDIPIDPPPDPDTQAAFTTIATVDSLDGNTMDDSPVGITVEENPLDIQQNIPHTHAMQEIDPLDLLANLMPKPRAKRGRKS